MKSPKFFQYLIVSVLLQSVMLFAASQASAFGPVYNPMRVKTSPVDTQGLATKGPDNLTKPGQTPQLGGQAPPPQNQQWPTVSGKTVADLYPAGSDPWFDKKNKIKKSDIKLPDGVISEESFAIMKALANQNDTPYPATGPSMGVSLMKAALLQNALANEPQRAMHDAEIQGQAQTTQAGDAAADTARGQAASAISFCSSYLENFTTQPQWNMVRDQIFVPMAILLLLPGAVLAQARAIVAAGSPVLGEVNPFEGILRSIVAIFLIPATALVVNYGIDLNNSIAYTIQTEYTRIFGSDMYRDALCAEMRATPVRQSQSNRNALDQQTYQGKPLLGGTTPFAQFEGAMMENSIQDPCAGINNVPAAAANENMQSGMIATRMMMNGSNASLTAAWNILCAFQLAYLYYLWCVGPIMAALWVYPLRTLRNALPSWVEGVVTLCFWSLFWNTVILLIACFKGVDETGTMITTALNFLATASVKYAFDFAGLVKAAGQEAAGMAAGQAKNAASAGGGGGQHGGGSQRHGGASNGGRRSSGALASRNGGGKEYAANLGGRSGERKVAGVEAGREGGGTRDGGRFGGMLINASYEGPSVPSRSILEAASAGRGFERSNEGAGKRVASAEIGKIDTPPLVAKDKGVGDRLATIDSPIKMNPNEPGVHRDAQGRITGIDVADAGGGRAAFQALAVAMAKEDGRGVTLGGEGSEGRVGLGLNGVDAEGAEGKAGLGLNGVGGDDGASLPIFAALAAGQSGGLSNVDVLRQASLDMGVFGGAAKDSALITPLGVEGAVVGGKANPELAAKNPLALDLAAANQDHLKLGTVGPLLLSNTGDGQFNIPANALVGMPPLENSGAATVAGFDPNNGQPINVDLSRSLTDGSNFVDIDNTLAVDSNLLAVDNTMLATDVDQLSIDQGDITNLNSALYDASIGAGNTFNYDAGDPTFVDASQLTQAQLAALTNSDPAALANSALPLLAREGVDGVPAGLSVNGLPANGVDTYSSVTGLPINGGDTLIHAPHMIDASTLNASTLNASMINNGGASYTDVSQNGAMRDLIQPAAGTVADTALSSTFSMFNRDTSVNTSAVEVWTPNQLVGGGSAEVPYFAQAQGTPTSFESMTTNHTGGGSVNYDYNAGSIDQSLITANGGPVNYEYNSGSSANFNPTSISDLTNNNSCQVSVDNGSYLTPTSAVQLQGGGSEYVASNPQYDNSSFASYETNNSSCTVDGGAAYSNASSFSTYSSATIDNSATVDGGTAYSNASSFATYSSATIDNSATVDGSQVYNTAGDQYADHSQTYSHSTQGNSTDIAYSSAPAINNDTTFCSAPATYNNDIAYGSSATHYNNDVSYGAPATQYTNDVSYGAPATQYNNDVTYSAPSTQQYDTSGACTADNARYAAYSTGGTAADANWTTNFSAAPTTEGDNIAYHNNNTYGTESAQVQAPARSTDSWFDSGNTNIASAAAAPMIESPRANDVVGHSDLGIAMPIVPKQIFASAEPAAPAPVAKAPVDAPRTLAMNTTKAVNTNKLTAAMGRAAGQSRNGMPAANNQTVVASNGAGANGVVPARTTSGAPEYARYQPQGPNGNEPPPVFDRMPDSLQNHLMLANQRGGRIQKSDVDEEATMKMRLDQMTGFDSSTPV